MKHLLQHFFLFCHSGSPSSPKSPDLWNLSYHNAKEFATEITDRDICILAEKVTAQGMVLSDPGKKYCAQSEKTATSPSCKQITQPRGAATPRNSDAHKRIAVPKAFCVLREHTRPRPTSGKVRRSDTRPGDVCERAERSEGSDTTPIRNAPLFRRVSRCVRSFSESRVCTHFHS